MLVKANKNNSKIIIVGRNPFQNKMLALNLEGDKSFYEILIFCSFDQVKKEMRKLHPKERGSMIVLIDCFGLDRKEIMKILYLELTGLLSITFVVMFNLQEEINIEKQAIQAGVHGFIYTHDDPKKLSRLVGALLKGEMWISRKSIKKLFKPEHVIPSCSHSTLLTPRENEVLALITGGYSNQKIANKLCISPHTVRTHVYNIYKKINVTSRPHAINWAYQNLKDSFNR